MLRLIHQSIGVRLQPAQSTVPLAQVDYRQRRFESDDVRDGRPPKTFL
jgi:hypothetical protein